MTTTTRISNNQIHQTKEPAQLVWFRLMFKSLSAVLPIAASKLAFKFFTTPRKTPATPFPKELINEASEHYLPFEGRRLKVYSWGFHGPKILLVHGWESQSSTYRIMIPALLEHGFSVVAFDAPAHGASDGKSITMPRYGEAIKTVHDYYKFGGGIKFIVGHSFGGLSSAWSVAHHELDVEKLVMISMPSNVKRLIKDFCQFLEIPAKVENLMIKKIEKITQKEIDAFSVLNFKDRIGTKEILLVHDVQDDKVPYSHFEQLNHQWKDPKYITTSSLGHNKTIKDPEIIGRISNFLTV